MKNYYRIYLGKGNIYAQKGFEEGYIGLDFGFSIDLSSAFLKADGAWTNFNHIMFSEYLPTSPEKSKIAAGLALS